MLLTADSFLRRTSWQSSCRDTQRIWVVLTALSRDRPRYLGLTSGANSQWANELPFALPRPFRTHLTALQGISLRTPTLPVFRIALPHRR